MNTDRYTELRLGLDPPRFQQKIDYEGGSIMQPRHSARPDQDVLSAWREGLAEAAPSQDLEQQLLQQESELLPRFAAHYDDLTHLPRSMRRRLQRQWKRSLAGLALLLALGTAPALAATIKVGGGCTLVDAITAANTDNAIGRCTAGHGADTIVLPTKSTQTLTRVNNGYVGPSGLPLITSTITIAGNGSTIARSQAPGTPEFRIFIVGQNGNLTLKQTKVTGGSLSGQNGGGGVYRRNGTLTLIGCTISGNSAYLGGGVANSVGGTLTVTNSTVSGNTATGNVGGGGIFNNGNASNGDGILKVTNSIISGNIGRNGRGGGVDNDGSATLTNSTISSNSAPYGGGVANLFSGSLTLTNSTIFDNAALRSGGGVNNYQGVVTLTNSTISGNSVVVNGVGGGASNNFGKMVFVDSTVFRNTASKGGGVYSGGRSGNLRSDVVLTDTLISGNILRISGNTAPTGAEVFQAPGGVVTANRSNLFGHSFVTNALALGGGGLILSGASDINATSDGNRPTALSAIVNTILARNGGPTETHALVAGSPAIDAVNNGACPPPATDQRGVPRPQDGNQDGTALCDIGAFER